MRKSPFHTITFFFFLFFFHTSFAQQTTSLTLLKQYAITHQQQLAISPKDVEGLFVTSEYTDATTGIRHIYSVQKLNGLAITGSSFSLHASGTSKVHASRLLALAKSRILPVTLAVPATTAIANVMDAIGYTAERKIEVKTAAQGTDPHTVYKRNESAFWDIPIRLVYYNNLHLKSLVPAWEVQMMDVYKHHYWLAYVDAATGKVLEKKDLIIHCNFEGGVTDVNAVNESTNALTPAEAAFGLTAEESVQSVQSLPDNKYRIYNIPFENPIDPGAKHALISKSGDTLSSPDGWHQIAGGAVTYNYTHGNNV